MKGEVLFLSHRIPFPPDRGDKIRSHHVLRRIAELAPVHVATLGDDARDMAEQPTLAALAASHCLVRRGKPLPLAGAEAVLRGKPVSLTAFFDPRLAHYVETVLRERPIDTIYVFSGQMGQYVPAAFKGRVICDFVDVDSAKFAAYAQQAAGPRRWLHAREARLLAAEEARLAQRSDAALLISDEEAALFRASLAPGDPARGKVGVLRNGIDAAAFDPDSVLPEPRLLGCAGPRLIFTGQMDYAPNVAAALRVAERLLPGIRARYPEATFHVVGRNPAPALMAHHGRNGCYVWGEVDDIRTWLSGADLALVPLEIARGVQNKVLEAMAMTLPAVLTPAAATGIGAAAGRHFEAADADEALIGTVCALLADPVRSRSLGVEARRFVIEELSWPAVLAPLAGLLGRGDERARDAA